MSKLSKRISIYVVSMVCYIIIIGMILYSVVNFRNEYRMEEKRYINTVESSIIDALYTDNIVQELQSLGQKYAMEVMVHEDDQLIYSSIPLQEGTSLKGIVNDNAKVQESFKKLEVQNKEYTIWYVIYQIPFIKTMESFLAKVNLIVVFIYLLLIVLVMLFEFRLLLPLRRVARSIEMAENNELDDLQVDNEKDSLNHRLTNFFLKQRRTLKNVRTHNTTLEIDLALEREHLENTIHLSRGLIHDLKSPVYNVKMDCEIQLETETDTNQRRLLERNIELCTQLLTEINGLLKVLREDVYTLDKSIEEIDGVGLVYATQKHHVSEMRRKQMSFSFEGAETEIFYQNKVGVQLLFHNIFSNMVLYSVPNSYIEVIMERIDNRIMIKCSNKTDEKNMQKIQDGMKYDSYNEVYVSDLGNAYSSGNGLYLIRQLAKFLDGECTYVFDGDIVTTILTLPDKE
ncbi:MULTISPECIES: hypothetical protein [unclassified Breznakia]|uniref:sensor histidine kinase n=1 Tax=unclassified Breznakia TaxID=2623764 RepID=UPI0024752BE3|nr:MULTISPECIES: hypothetical protein [unclassified Breznakia]MDH6365964.1 signal transduction histidine kinase [Breznakia sp. PH1-1]MDH6403104.1 signal transduction histidine kinase [Breznakia sp. PF1-11]MDH6410813.1 signal transduction histidine kinase [Breznakia sp. PFB1-11]MDH6413130.1 signal transduction histidine kinase [Breznakia sp. PFB1-14]MDH6415498.1 signal transduction histidine kinase [Breznakia sp. PFB1-4]